MLKNNIEVFKILSYKTPGFTFIKPIFIIKIALSTICQQAIHFPLQDEDEEHIYKLFDTLVFKNKVLISIKYKIAISQRCIRKKKFSDFRSSNW